MPEEVLFETETRLDRTEIAEYFRTVAEALDAGESITLRAGDQSVELNPPPRPTFEVKAEREGAPDRPGELSIEFELEWNENGDGAGELQIE